MPRAVATKYVSGTEISRMRTKITASAPRAIRISRSGTAAGSTIPAARGDRGCALRTWRALGSRPEGTGWLRRLHRRSMGTKAHRRARGRAISGDEEAVQDVEVQLEGTANGSPAPLEVALDDTGFVE